MHLFLSSFFLAFLYRYQDVVICILTPNFTYNNSDESKMLTSVQQSTPGMS